jgi:NACHT domain
MLKEYVIKKLLDAGLERAKKLLTESRSSLVVTRDDIESSIYHHLRAIKNWSKSVSFSDLKQAKRTTDIFINLDLYVYPRRIRIQRRESIANIPLNALFEHAKAHIVLLGQPGAGKTTSMKHLCQEFFTNENFLQDLAFPILIKFRDLNRVQVNPDTTILIEQICNILGLKIEFRESLQVEDRGALRQKLVMSILEELRVLLILDGFDELMDTRVREKAINDIRTFAEHLEYSKMIVTSRTADFVYSIDNVAPYEICPLNEVQIATFAQKWLNDNDQAKDFLCRIYESPFADTTIRPLTLAHLCAIYERIGKIPDKPRTVYRKIINLLLEEWDQQRSVKRSSRYANFETDRKFEFLSHLAHKLTTLLNATVFSSRHLLHIYGEIYQDYDLAEDEAKLVVNELESHTGLILQSGFDQYEFVHKSLQEYLTAEHLVKLPIIPYTKDSLLTLPNELAITVTISSRPSEYITELILRRLMSAKPTADFLKAFLSRLILEKPDFNSSDILVFALVALHSHYLQVFYFGKRSDFVRDDHIRTEFERTIRHVSRKSSVDYIEKFYKFDKTIKMSGNHDLYKMVRTKKGDSGYEFPEVLYLSTSFLQEGRLPSTQ